MQKNDKKKESKIFNPIQKRSSTVRTNQTETTFISNDNKSLNQPVIQKLSHFDLMNDSSDEDSMQKNILNRHHSNSANVNGNYSNTSNKSSNKSSQNTNNQSNKLSNNLKLFSLHSNTSNSNHNIISNITSNINNNIQNSNTSNTNSSNSSQININNKGNTHSGPSGLSNYTNNNINFQSNTPNSPSKYNTMNNSSHVFNPHKKYRSGIRSAPGSDNGRSTISTTEQLFNLCGRGLMRRIKPKNKPQNKISQAIGQGIGDFDGYDVDEYMSSDSDEDTCFGWNKK